MTFDATTETVAHFIGLFGLAVEEARLRQAYDAFRAEEALAEEPEPHGPVVIDLQAPYSLGDYDPGPIRLSQPLESLSLARDDIGPLLPLLRLPVPTTPVPGVTGDLPPAFPAVQLAFDAEWTLAPPGSVAVVIHQFQFLEDNDVLVFDPDLADFASLAPRVEALQALATLAAEAAGFVIPVLPAPGAALGFAVEAAEAMVAAAAASPEGFTLSVFAGADAVGVYVNGKAVDALPLLDEILPGYHSPEEDTATADSEDGPGPFDGLGRSDTALPDPDPGIGLVTGGNLVANEAVVASNWLDAPVIAVAGDVYDLVAISQVNVLSDRDTGGADGTASAALNAAAILREANPAGTDKAPGAAPDLPEDWVVTRIEADLVAVNWIKQQNFVTDLDCAQISETGWDTHLVLGDNTVVNAAALAEIGFGYDLIVIGGNMISVSMITQMNVLLDADKLSVDYGDGVEWSGGDNLLYNAASYTGIGIDSYAPLAGAFAESAVSLGAGGDLAKGVIADPLFDGVDLLRVLYIDGDFVQLDLFEQTNVLGDADQVQLALDAARAEGAEVAVTAGSNAVLNLASVAHHGVDSTVLHGGEVYTDALIYQAELIDIGAAPTGVAQSGLTGDAVAMLIAGLGDCEVKDDCGESLSAPQIHDGTASPDAMQTMLA